MNPTFTPPAEPVAQLVLTLRSDGQLSVGGKWADKIQALGVLELAKAAILTQGPPQPGIVPGVAIPRLNGLRPGG